MTKIQILGTGCPKCQQLTANAQAAADQLGLDYQIEKVTDLGDIANYGVMMTPALAVDGEVKSAGKVLEADAIQAMLG